MCCAGRPALGPKLDGVRRGPSCGESCCDSSRKAIAASVGIRKGARQRFGFKSSSWEKEPPPLSLCGDPQAWRWGEGTLFDALAWIQMAADQGIETDFRLLKNRQAKARGCR